MTKICSVFVGVGSYLPTKIVTNKDLEKQIDTSDEWIKKRTGITRRHIAADNEFTSDLAIRAAQNSLDYAGLKATDIDVIIVATTTPDLTFPATATIVQNTLGNHHGAAFDMQAVCCGFVYALATADSYIKNGLADRVLIIGAETMSRLLDWQDRTTCVLFGDGAGAVILQKRVLEDDAPDIGVLTSKIRSDGAYKDKLCTLGGPSTTQTVGTLQMQGREVFRHAVSMVADVVTSAFEDTGTTAQDLDWFVPHQANKRIIEGSANFLGIAPEKIIQTVHLHANTSAASVPLALDHAIKQGKIEAGQLVMLEAMGGGFTWGANLVRWA